MSRADKAERARIRAQRAVIADLGATVITKRTRRRVLMIVEGHFGKDRATACVHLDDAACQRLGRRLLAISGGRRTLR